MLTFNHRLAAAIEDNLDLTDTIAALDPDPLRYMWVDEGDGQIPAQLVKAAAMLDAAPRLTGQLRGRTRVRPESRAAARPTVAVRGDTTVLAWLEWQEDRGDRLVAEVDDHVDAVVDGPEDLFRPTAVVAADGVPWVLFGRSVGGTVGVWASRFTGGRWSGPEPVSDTDGPSFNQEVVATPDGGFQICWQGRDGGRFAIFARRFDGAWGPTERVSAGAAGNVWDPTLALCPDGVAYAWTEYVEVLRRRRSRSRHGDSVRRLTGGSDYALHPSLATTADGRLWCAFDVVSVEGHGGSGPTHLRPRRGRSDDHGDDQDGMREAGASVPPELLPEVSASLRVVGIEADGLVEPPGSWRRGSTWCRPRCRGSPPPPTAAWSSATASTGSCR